jgi:hypothetical protein
LVIPRSGIVNNTLRLWYLAGRQYWRWLRARFRRSNLVPILGTRRPAGEEAALLLLLWTIEAKLRRWHVGEEEDRHLRNWDPGPPPPESTPEQARWWIESQPEARRTHEETILRRNELLARMKADFRSLWGWVLAKYWLMAAASRQDRTRLRYRAPGTQRSIDLLVNGTPMTFQVTFSPNRVSFEQDGASIAN